MNCSDPTFDSDLLRIYLGWHWSETVLVLFQLIGRKRELYDEFRIGVLDYFCEPFPDVPFCFRVFNYDYNNNVPLCLKLWGCRL